MQANVSLRNLFGAADQWRLTAEYGHRSSFDFAALFRLPRAGGRPWTVRAATPRDPRRQRTRAGAFSAREGAGGRLPMLPMLHAACVPDPHRPAPFCPPRAQPDIGVFRRSLNLESYSSLADTMRGLELGVSRCGTPRGGQLTWCLNEGRGRRPGQRVSAPVSEDWLPCLGAEQGFPVQDKAPCHATRLSRPRQRQSPHPQRRRRDAAVLHLGLAQPGGGRRREPPRARAAGGLFVGRAEVDLGGGREGQRDRAHRGACAPPSAPSHGRGAGKGCAIDVCTPIPAPDPSFEANQPNWSPPCRRAGARAWRPSLGGSFRVPATPTPSSGWTGSGRRRSTKRSRSTCRSAAVRTSCCGCV